MLSNDLVQFSRYSWLGTSLEEIVINFTTNPLATVWHVLFAMDGWVYLGSLIVPLLCLPVIGFEFLLPGAGDLLANLLSANPMPRAIFSYHSATLIPVFIVAAIYGSRRISFSLSIFKQERLAFVTLAVTLLLGWSYFPFFSLPGGHHFWAPTRVFTFSDDSYATIRGMIPPQISLSVQANIGAHFTQREKIYIYPEMVGDADVVVLRLDSPTLMQRGRDKSHIASLAHHLQMDPLDYLKSIKTLLEHDIYSRVFWHDPWLLFMKGDKTLRHDDDIMSKIETLKLDWQLIDTTLVN
jgi:uncharacterized membrane protein